MTISDRVKFLKKSKGLFVDGAVATSLRGDASGNNADSILNHNRANGWMSLASDDTIVETLIVDLPSSTSIDRLIVNDHNLKDITIWVLDYLPFGLEENEDDLLQEDGDLLQTESGTNFPNADFDRFMLNQDEGYTLLDQNSGRIIYEQIAAFDADDLDDADTLQLKLTGEDLDVSTSYWAFSSVTAVRVVLQALATQTTNAQKYIKSLVLTDEIGTFEGYPSVQATFTRGARATRMLGNKSRVIKGPIAFGASLGFRDYPGQADADLLETLLEYDEDFLIWLCGGVAGSNYFNYTVRGFNVDDIFLCQLSSGLTMSYTRNIYLNGYNSAIRLVETV
jgi:hypothetical protein